MSRDKCLSDLPDNLINENGGEHGFVCIWRMSQKGEGVARYNTTVGEFLSLQKNQSGTWLIDGGWGSPPGPIYVRWNDDKGKWENGGYCGKRF